MKKRAWKTRIKNACTEAGTYKPYFDYTIDMAAGYLEQRDALAEQMKDEDPVSERTNKDGITSKIRNPIFVMWDDMNKAALTCLKELGLTPTMLRKINEETFTKIRDEKNGNNLIELLEKARAKKDT